MYMYASTCYRYSHVIGVCYGPNTFQFLLGFLGSLCFRWWPPLHPEVMSRSLPGIADIYTSIYTHLHIPLIAGGNALQYGHMYEELT